MEEYIMEKRQDLILGMAGRAERAYKRELRRRREQRRKIATALLTVLLVAVCVVSYHAISSKASSNEQPVSYKYYTERVVKYGETLWNIADGYIDYGQYGSKQDYLEEVCRINHLYDASEIHAGQRIILPYFSDRFVK